MTSPGLPAIPDEPSPARQGAALQQAIAICAARGWRLEGVVGGVATMASGSESRPNHVLHLLLTVFTCGFWAPVWLLMAIIGNSRPHRLLVIADEFGQVIYQRAAS